MPKKTFIHHDGALGDLLLSLPCIEAIKDDSELIHIAGRPDVVDFLLKIGYVHGKSDAGSPLFLSLFTDSDDGGIKDFLSGFDRSYLFTASEHSLLGENIRAILPQTEIIRTIPPEGAGMHVSDYRMRQLTKQIRSKAPSPLPSPTSFFTIPFVYMEKAKEVLLSAGYDFERPLIALHPGSGSRKKCWPLENFIGLVRKMRETGNNFFVLFSGPAEGSEMKNALKDLTKSLEGNCLYVPDADLPTIASLANLSDLYIGNDSGITHLVSALGKKVIALFGPTDPLLWRPPGEARIVSSMKKCSPCERIISSELRDCDFECLSGIPVERVFGEAEALQVPAQSFRVEYPFYR